MQQKYKIIISDQAQRELNEILDYIEIHLSEPDIAKKLFFKLKEKILELGNFPEKYPRLRSKYLFGSNVRKSVIRNYVIIYKVDKNARKVEISHIFYAKSDWMKDI